MKDISLLVKPDDLCLSVGPVRKQLLNEYLGLSILIILVISKVQQNSGHVQLD